MIQLLKQFPYKAIPIVQERMKRKLENFKENKDNARHQLNDTCQKNFAKSLDHRSFTFKNNEKKNMNAKYFLGEI